MFLSAGPAPLAGRTPWSLAGSWKAYKIPSWRTSETGFRSTRPVRRPTPCSSRCATSRAATSRKAFVTAGLNRATPSPSSRSWRTSGSRSASPTRGTTATCSARSTTSHRSRSQVTRSTAARTFARSAACSTNALSGSRRSGATRSTRSCSPTSRKSRRSRARLDPSWPPLRAYGRPRTHRARCARRRSRQCAGRTVRRCHGLPQRAAEARLAQTPQGPSITVAEGGFDWRAGVTGAMAATFLLLGAALAVRTAKRGRVALGW